MSLHLSQISSVVLTSCRIFQHLLHLLPSAFFTSTDIPLISSIKNPSLCFVLSNKFADEVIEISARSISLRFEIIVEGANTSIDASRLDPIILFRSF